MESWNAVALEICLTMRQRKGNAAPEYGGPYFLLVFFASISTTTSAFFLWVALLYKGYVGQFWMATIQADALPVSYGIDDI